MASSKESSPCAGSGSKSKQERIRDNQRRSRARRQEYLADLERRLRDSHTVCRDADLQKSAFLDLQRENGCLRHLLTLSGVSPDVIETFIRQHAAPDEPNGTPASSMRQLKPRLQISPSHLAPSQRPADHSRSTSAQSHRTNRSPSGDSATTTSTNFGSHDDRKLYGNTLTSQGQHSQDLGFAPQMSLDWLFEQPSTMSANRGGEDFFCCDSFLVPSNGALLENDSNSVLCSVARDLISQYDIPPQDMETIKLKLATGFSRSTSPSSGCRVNNQLLFQVLNEVSAKYG